MDETQKRIFLFRLDCVLSATEKQKGGDCVHTMRNIAHKATLLHMLVEGGDMDLKEASERTLSIEKELVEFFQRRFG
jgi:hypothetical protein